MRLAALLAVALVVPSAMSATTPPQVRAVSMPTAAVVGASWRATVSVLPPARGALQARGPGILRAPLVPAKARGRYTAALRFPKAGIWAISVVVGKRTTKLGRVGVDIPADARIVDPISLAAEPSGSIVVGQLRSGATLRISGPTVTQVAGELNTFQVYVGPDGRVYGAARDGAVHRVDGSTWTRITPPMDASAVAVDAAGNLYITVYVGFIKKIAPDGTVTTVVGNGTEGYSGDGGPGVSATIFHPHAVTIGKDGALYIADTENRRIRRLDLATGTITTFGGDVGITVALAAGPDGSIYSADVVRAGLGGGVTRTTPAGVTTRILADPAANGVAATPDGTVYVNEWDNKRILRIGAGGRLEPVARG